MQQKEGKKKEGRSEEGKKGETQSFYMHRYAAAKSLQSCPTLCDPTLPTLWAAHQAPPIPGILQARTLEWVAISFSICSTIKQGY